MSESLAYDAFSKKLGLVETELAEAHGTLAGLCCAGLEIGPSEWSEFLEEHWPGLSEGENRTVVEGLYAQLGRDLSGGDLSLELLLPDEQSGFFERSQSLAAWANGLVYGLSFCQTEAVRAAGEDFQANLEDLSRIARELAAITEDYQANDSDETDWFEVLEYVRALTQSLFFDLNQKALSQPLLQ